MTSQIKLAIVAIAFVIGAIVGSGLCTLIHRASAAADLKAQIDHDQKVMDQRIEDERAAAKRIANQLDQERSKTSTLNSQLADLRTTNQTLTEKISHVDFHPAPQVAPSHPAVVCPGHPVASPEFLQLYDAAAGATGGAAHGAGPG